MLLLEKCDVGLKGVSYVRCWIRGNTDVDGIGLDMHSYSIQVPLMMELKHTFRCSD